MDEVERKARSGALSRRMFVAGGGGVLIASRLVDPAAATPERMAEAMRAALGAVEVKPGRVRLEIPSLAENGNSVPLLVAVESPMSAADHVASIYIFSEKNPSANVVHFHLGPRAGRAQVNTNIRLADTQTVTAVARMSDGSCWSATASVIVTISACLEES
jgi:sulfur-oxidizing protein SoxY